MCLFERMTVTLLPAEEPRCLAYDTPAPMRHIPKNWCPLRETCARALAIRTDRPECQALVEFRVCKVGKTDKYIEAA